MTRGEVRWNDNSVSGINPVNHQNLQSRHQPSKKRKTTHLGLSYAFQRVLYAPLMPSTYLTTLTAFTHFLTVYTHTLLYLRALYPPTSFIRSRFHNTPVYQSRHPQVCAWILDAIAAVREELLKGTVARIGIVVYNYNTGKDGGKEGGSKDKGSPRIMERYMLDVSSFPVVSKDERNAVITWDDDNSNLPRSQSNPPPPGVDEDEEDVANAIAEEDLDPTLTEQFRAALLSLTTRCAQLSPLPPNCSFNISMELKDEGSIDPPLGHPQPWIPVVPSLQKTGRGNNGSASNDAEGEAKPGGVSREGQDLGGVRVTPIRTVEVGVFRFETWVEEGRAKFDMLEAANTQKSV